MPHWKFVFRNAQSGYGGSARWTWHPNIIRPDHASPLWYAKWWFGMLVRMYGEKAQVVADMQHEWKRNREQR